MKNKNLLITGCAGFIGSHTVDCFLEDKNYSVFGLDKMTYAANEKNLKLAFENERFKFYKGDICDSDFVENICRENNIDWIINFAAETHVDNSISDSKEFLKSNFLGVHSLLEVCKSNKNVKLFQISTDEVYGVASDNVCFSENDKLNPKNPYSATKAAAEHLIKSYVNTYKIKTLMVRPSNNYGPRQHLEKFIPTILNSLKNNKKIPIYGNGNQIREWTYVKDTAKAIKFIIEKSDYNQCYNVTSNVEMKNISLVEQICSILKKDFNDNVTYVEDRLGHDQRYSITNLKIKNLGFKKYSNFENNLIETINFFGESFK